MQPQLQALADVKEFLDRHKIKHMVIGGIANAVWGRPPPLETQISKS